MEITARSSYFSRMKLWSKERFPLFNLSTALLMYLLPKMFLVVTQSLSFRFDIFDLSSIFFIAANLFILRILDEHKDYQSDLINNPNRVLQRGIVSLKELRSLGYVAAIIELITFFLMRPNQLTILCFLFLNFWIFLMFKEFFVRDWLRKQLFLYSFLHLLVSPLITLVILFTLGFSWSLGAFGLLMGLGFSVGWVYEISRKTKGPMEETQDLSFSKEWGYRNSLLMIFVFSCFSLGLTAEIGREMLIKNFFFYLILILVLSLEGFQLLHFFWGPSAKERKKNEGMAALIGAVGYVMPVVWVWLQNR